MRLLWLIPYSPWPADHGGKIRVWEEITGLAARGATIDVIYPQRQDEPTIPQVENVHWRGYPSGLDAHRIRKIVALPTPLPVAARAVYDRTTHRHVRAVAHEYDALVLEQPYQERFTRGLPGEVPLVFIAQNVEHALMAQMARSAPKRETRFVYHLDSRKFRRIERRVFKRADLIVAVSQEDRRCIELLSDAPLTTRPNGVDLAAYPYRQSRPGPATQLLMTGTLGYPPNHEAALAIHREILPRIRESEPDAEIKLVGSLCPPDLKRLHDPSNGFHVVGYVDDVLPYLADADVFLMPLRMGGGTRLKALQAMSCGVPIVSTAQGVEGIPLVAGREVRISDTSIGLAAACIELLRDAEMRRNQAAAARLVAEREFDWNVIIDGLYGDLESTIRASR